MADKLKIWREHSLDTPGWHLLADELTCIVIIDDDGRIAKSKSVRVLGDSRGYG